MKGFNSKVKGWRVVPQAPTYSSRVDSMRSSSSNSSHYRQESTESRPRTPAQPQDVEMANPYPSPPYSAKHARGFSLEVPYASRMPSPHGSNSHLPNRSPSPSPSVLPPPDNESRALASLSTQCAMSLATVAAELAPIPCIGILVGCLTVVFQAVEKSRVNRDQWKLLQGRCVMVTRIAGSQVSNYGGEHYQGLAQASNVLRGTITHIGARANHWNQMQEWLAFVQFQSISDEIRNHFAALDHCLSFFSYATDIAQMQWVGEFSAVQREELSALQQMHSLLKSMNVSLDLMGQNAEEIKVTTAHISEQLRKVLDDKTVILQDQSTTTVAAYTDTQRIVNTILTVTKMQLPPKLLLGRQCILDAPVPIKTGMTCDIYSASFMGGEKVAKKVFRIGMSEKEHVERYAQRFLRDAQLWAEFRSDYTLPFYGVGMEAFDGDRHFQLYMVSPLMKNFDAVTYLKQHKTNPGMKEGIMRIITDAARGLQYLHDRQPPVVHSGLRGDNILITDSGGAVLGGFGLTKALRDSTGDEKVPPAVMTGKTESQRWMAPEMFAEDTPILQTPSDVWSWAMASLELISGLIPYHQNRQPHTVMTQIRGKKLPQREKHADFEKYALKPDEMWELLEGCWQYEPEKRPAIDEVVVALKKMSKSAAGSCK